MKSQLPDVQAGVEFAGPAGHVVQRVPHVATAVSDTHVLPHAWKPVLQAMPQLVPLHVALPLAGVAHGVQLVPQVAGAEFDAHAPPHAWKFVLHETPHDMPSPVALPLLGA